MVLAGDSFAPGVNNVATGKLSKKQQADMKAPLLELDLGLAQVDARSPRVIGARCGNMPAPLPGWLLTERAFAHACACECRCSRGQDAKQGRTLRSRGRTLQASGRPLQTGL